EIYAATVVPLHDGFAALADGFDRWVVQGFLVRGASGAVDLFGRVIDELNVEISTGLAHPPPRVRDRQDGPRA
ncbi:hypothetical protein, partial [Phenylobacterium sp.]|uniref:hypothetical protein n=1 Tax=Phenylobacterium sp. TaxID=1871053 RepID=UPI00272F5377